MSAATELELEFILFWFWLLLFLDDADKNADGNADTIV